jgi:hypothetical protein
LPLPSREKTLPAWKAAATELSFGADLVQLQNHKDFAGIDLAILLKCKIRALCKGKNAKRSSEMLSVIGTVHERRLLVFLTRSAPVIGFE